MWIRVPLNSVIREGWLVSNHWFWHYHYSLWDELDQKEENPFSSFGSRRAEVSQEPEVQVHWVLKTNKSILAWVGCGSHKLHEKAHSNILLLLELGLNSVLGKTKRKKGCSKEGEMAAWKNLHRGGIRRKACTGNVAKKVTGRFEELGNVRGEGDMLHNVTQIGWDCRGRGFFILSLKVR